MASTGLRRRLAGWHRWLTLIFTPVLIPIMLAAAILAVLPFLGAETPVRPAVDAAAVERTLRAADSSGQATAASLSGDGRTLTLALPGSVKRTLDVATGAPVPAPSEDAASTERSWTFQHTHPFGLPDAVTTFASVALTLLAVTGLFLARPRRGARGVRAWHVLAGWVLLPFVLLTPVTGVMLGFHLVGAPRPEIVRFDRPVVLAEVLDTARAANLDLSQLVRVESFHGIAASVTVAEGTGEASYVVSGDGRVARTVDGGIVRALHVGSWAEPWSRLVNLLSVVALAGLNLSGLWLWGRRVVLRALRPRPALA
jgi:hypothetical protein